MFKGVPSDNKKLINGGDLGYNMIVNVDPVSEPKLIPVSF
jgi:hypothetical protein